jgi:hypothetical protein
MDAHFNEYLAAVAGMQELYGERGDEHLSDFHQEHPAVAPAVADAVVAAALP